MKTEINFMCIRKIISIGCILVCSFNYTFAEDIEITPKRLDSLWAVWKNPACHDSARLNAMDVICWQVYLFSQPDSARYYAQQIYDFAVRKKNTIYLAKALNILGTYFTIKDKEDSAVFYYKKGLVLCRKTKNYYTLSSILNNLSNIEYERANYVQSLEYIYESLRISEQIKDEYLIMSNLANIGSTYGGLGDSEKEMVFFQRALKHGRAINQKNVIKTILFNIGCNYYNKRSFLEAKPYYDEALKISYEVNDNTQASTALLGLGRIYNEIGKNDSSMLYLQKSLDLMKTLGDENGTGNVYDEIATVYLSEGDYKTALKYVQEAMRIADEESDLFLKRNAAETLYKIYKNTNHPEKALEMFELYKSTNDSIINDNNHKALLRSQLQYEFDKKAEIIKEQNRLKDLKLTRRSYIIVVMMIVALLSFVIYYLIIKQNKILAAKKAVELEQKLLGSQMSTHFTFNAINSIQEYILNNQNDEAHYYLSEFSKLMRMVLANNREKMIAISSEIELLEKYVLFEEQRLKEKINFVVVNSEHIELGSIKIPSMLLQPVIENSIWHGLRFKEGQKEIRVHFSKLDTDKLKIEVTDNGTGLKSTGNPNHKSHGLYIIKERIGLLYNKKPDFTYFDIRNNSSRSGTITTIVIPLIDEYN